jgi:hypothetical protein
MSRFFVTWTFGYLTSCNVTVSCTDSFVTVTFTQLRSGTCIFCTDTLCDMYYLYRRKLKENNSLERRKVIKQMTEERIKIGFTYLLRILVRMLPSGHLGQVHELSGSSAAGVRVLPPSGTVPTMSICSSVVCKAD